MKGINRDDFPVTPDDGHEVIAALPPQRTFRKLTKSACSPGVSVRLKRVL